MTKPKKTPRQTAEEHVDWFLDLFVVMVRPLLISFMEHGIKHGQRAKEK